MGLIKAIAGAAGGVLADQWKEFFYCEAMSADVICTKGQKKVTKRYFIIIILGNYSVPGTR